MNWEEDMRAELSKLRAEVERLRVALDAAGDAAVSKVLKATERANVAASRIAAATELLGRIIKYSLEDGAVTPGFTRLLRVLAEAEAFLAAQPAAPTRGCVHFDFMRGMVCDECKTSA
jgi:hypothetical protein